MSEAVELLPCPNCGLELQASYDGPNGLAWHRCQPDESVKELYERMQKQLVVQAMEGKPSEQPGLIMRSLAVAAAVGHPHLAIGDALKGFAQVQEVSGGDAKSELLNMLLGHPDEQWDEEE